MEKMTPFHIGLRGSCLGDSMEPFIKSTAKLTISVNNTNDYKVGDIVVFIQKSLFVAHRIISVNRKGRTVYFTLKGDNNSKVDGIFTTQQIVGRVDTIVQNQHIIDLNEQKHKLLKYVFVMYSLSNKNAAVMYLSTFVRKIKIFKYIFRQIVYV
jgi:signal peptidase I